MTHDEFIVVHTRYKMRDNLTMFQSTLLMYESFSNVPKSIDWRKEDLLKLASMQLMKQEATHAVEPMYRS
ncbi:hypothetical protein Gotur_028556 [Gossypium turneri]